MRGDRGGYFLAMPISSKKIIELAKQALEIEAAAITELIPRLDESFTSAIRMLMACKGKVVLTGMGKAGIIAQKSSATLSSTGTPSVWMHLAEAANGDLGRIDVQHDLIKACAGQWLQLGNWNKLLPAAKIILDNADTNLSYGNMQWYAKEFMKMSIEDISFMTLPNTGCMIRNLSYVSINVDDWITMVNTYLNPTDTPITKEDCNILYQLRPESGKYTVTAANYAVTNGGEVAGGVNSFFVNKG